MTVRGSVAVVGGGMAGLAAALEAADRGADVTLLEAAPTLGGTLAIAGGLVWAPESFEVARDWIPQGDATLQEMLVSELPDLWEWLGDNGVALGPVGPCLKEEPGRSRMGRGRMLVAGRAGDRREVVTTLADGLSERGVDVRLSSRVTSVAPAGAGWELGYRNGGEGRSLTCASVVFTSGGFHNDAELLRRYVTTSPESLVVRTNNRISDGLALRELTALGAEASARLSTFYGHTLPLVDDKDWSDTDDFLTATMYFTDYCVLMNGLGLRFKDESVGCMDEVNAQHGSRQAGGRYYTIFDERIRRAFVDADLVGMQGLGSARKSSRIEDVRRLGGTVLEEQTLSDLASAMDDEFGVPATNVRATLAAYNDSADPVRHLDPPRRRVHLPLTEPPFRAIPCVAGISHTTGGLRVRGDMSVQGPNLGGIFAAGADAGGVFSEVYAGGLAWAGVSGRRAGAAAARAASDTTRAVDSRQPADKN